MTSPYIHAKILTETASIPVTCLKTFLVGTSTLRAFKKYCMRQVYAFIHSGHFYSASSSPLLLRSVPDTTQTLCRNFTLKRETRPNILHCMRQFTTFQSQYSRLGVKNSCW